MDSSSKGSTFLLILVFSFSSSFLVGVCPMPTAPEPAPEERPITIPPNIGKLTLILPPIMKKGLINIPQVIRKPDPISPNFEKPPITLPTLTFSPPITHPPINRQVHLTPPPITGDAPITLPPVTVNAPINKRLVTGAPVSSSPPAPKNVCPIDTLKFGNCLDHLGGEILVGDPAHNECCPLIKNLTEIEAAACLCSTIKLKFLNIYAFNPIVVDLLISCGKARNPANTCY